MSGFETGGLNPSRTPATRRAEQGSVEKSEFQEDIKPIVSSLDELQKILGDEFDPNHHATVVHINQLCGTISSFADVLESVSTSEREAVQNRILTIEERLKFAQRKMRENKKQHLNPMNLPYWLDDEIPNMLGKLARIVSGNPTGTEKRELPKKESREEMIAKQLDIAAQAELTYEVKNKAPNTTIARALLPSYDAFLGLYTTSEEAGQRIAALVDLAKKYAQEAIRDKKTASDSWAWELGTKKVANEALTTEEKKALVEAQKGEVRRQKRASPQGMILTPSVENMLGKLLSSVKDIK